MEFIKAPLDGAYLINLTQQGDERGFFARLFCREEFIGHGLSPDILQVNNSYSACKGTLRGLHYQLPPKSETKLVRCILGAIYDVIVDIRPGSKTFGHHFGATLTAENRQMIYVPRGFAHGFLTLTDHSEVIYFVSDSYSKELERGIRWDDPKFNIAWPERPQLLSERDRSHPDFSEEYHLNEKMWELSR